MMVVAGVVVRFSIVVMVLRTLVRLMLGAVPRVVPVVVLRRLGGMVAATRVVVVVYTPRGRFPVRNITTGIQFGYNIDRTPCVRVAVDRAAVGIAVNRETIGIVAGSCPSYCGGDMGTGVAHGAVPIRVNLARGGQQGCRRKEGCFCILVHVLNRLIMFNRLNYISPFDAICLRQGFVSRQIHTWHPAFCLLFQLVSGRFPAMVSCRKDIICVS